jgi:SAM-dependent methyltransferase
MSEPPRSSYDEIAGMYHALWANWYLPAALPALESLFFSRVPPGERVLDVCCGSGHVTGELLRRGYRVTGIDASPALIELARRELPEVRFWVQDIRHLHLDEAFPAALSTFDSLNHLLTLGDLRQAFRAIYKTLLPGGIFVFDMNLEEAYSLDLQEWTVDISTDRIGLVRGTYDPKTKTASTELICFTKIAAANEDLWRRSRSLVLQRCYLQSEILMALQSAGFEHIESIPARAAGIASSLAIGRIFFTTWRAKD